MGRRIVSSEVASDKERHSFWAYEDEIGSVGDIALGGRVGLLRYGTCDNVLPDGWQIDLEGAAFPRLDPEEERDLVAADFRAGVPLTYGNGPSRTKLAYYHLSSHLGDEFLLKNPPSHATTPAAMCWCSAGQFISTPIGECTRRRGGRSSPT